MGTMTSKDTRRISFDNTFTLNPALTIQETIEDENVMGISSLATANNNNDGSIFRANSKSLVNTQEEGDIDYWAHRIEFLKKEHQLINKIIEIEYEKTVENTNKLFETPKISHEKIQKIKPCFEWRSKILQCYEDNPHQTLVCASMVQGFSKCVTSHRIED